MAESNRALDERQPTALRLDRVHKSYGDVAAVDDLSLVLEPGEFFSLLGPSGCGKTTTLRVIGGFETPDSGRVLLGGRDITDVPPHRREVNTVFQSYALFPHLNVFDNVAYGLRRRHVNKPEITLRVSDILGIVALPGLERRRTTQLSGGQQQRVALARALVNRPKLVLLDEPLGALDLKLRRQMQLELKRIQSELGITFLYVTHDQEEAMSMSDRIGVMNEGHIEQVGEPHAVYEHPASEFVAGFLGAANLLGGRIESRDGDWVSVYLHAGATVRVPARAVNGSANVKIGVRPEKITINEDGQSPSGANTLRASLQSSSFVGVGYECAFVTPTGEVITVYRQNVGGSLPGLGRRIELSWPPEHTFAVPA